MSEELLPFCACGCGERVTKIGNRFIHGHNRRGISLPPRTPEYCAAMSAATLGVPKPPRTPEHCAALSAAISKAKTGVPNSPEHNVAISKGMKNSEDVKAAGEAKTGVPLSPEHIAAIVRGQEEAGVHDAMRGGHDIVKHHYIYDHSDLALNTVQMTRSDHTSLHRSLQKLGYKVPHINVKRDN